MFLEKPSWTVTFCAVTDVAIHKQNTLTISYAYLQPFGSTKISKFDVAIGVPKDVSSFDVSVHYPVVMQVGYAFQYLSSVLSCQHLI